MSAARRAPRNAWPPPRRPNPARPAVRPAPPRSVPKKGEQKDSLLSTFDFAQTRSKKCAAPPRPPPPPPPTRCTLAASTPPRPRASPPTPPRLRPPRLPRDAELLWEAKYGEREGGKMTREQ